MNHSNGNTSSENKSAARKAEIDTMGDTVTSHYSKKSRIRLAFLGCLQNSCLGGILFGWASVDQTMLAASYTEGGANLTLSETTSIFSWSTSVGMISCLIMGGLVLDLFGPRACSLVAHLFIGIGCLLFATAKSFEQFLVAACLISLGGPGIQLSIINFANLFPQNQFLAVSLLNGTICISFSVLAVFDWIWESQKGAVSFRTFFFGLCFFIMGSAVASWLCFPISSFDAFTSVDNFGSDSSQQSSAIKRSKYATEQKHITTKPLHPHILEQSLDSILRFKITGKRQSEYIEATALPHHLIEQPLDSFLRVEQYGRDQSLSFMMSKNAIADGNSAFISLKDLQFHHQFFSGVYLRSITFFIVSCFLANFYIASFSTEMGDLQYFSQKETLLLGRILTLFMSAGLPATVVVGWMIDRLGLVICSFLQLALGQVQLFILLLAGPSEGLLIFSFLVYVLFRQFIFNVFITSIVDRLGFKYFGVLNGIGFTLSGLSQIFMNDLVVLVQGTCHSKIAIDQYNLSPMEPSVNIAVCDHGHWISLHVVELLLLVSLMLLPYADHKYEKSKEIKEEKFRQIMQISEVPTSEYGSLEPLNDRENATLDNKKRGSS